MFAIKLKEIMTPAYSRHHGISLWVYHATNLCVIIVKRLIVLLKAFATNSEMQPIRIIFELFFHITVWFKVLSCPVFQPL